MTNEILPAGGSLLDINSVGATKMTRKTQREIAASGNLTIQDMMTTNMLMKRDSMLAQSAINNLNDLAGRVQTSAEAYPWAEQNFRAVLDDLTVLSRNRIRGLGM
ncbi:hypothetical protein [Lactococcus lactis]|uniref:hypothetical protein n=1 Tax=Lactococcus lactis TaxID=1358 RepID=UPI003D171078